MLREESKNKYTAFVIDLGAAVQTGNLGYKTEGVYGTFRWSAPELAESEDF